MSKVTGQVNEDPGLQTQGCLTSEDKYSTVVPKYFHCFYTCLHHWHVTLWRLIPGPSNSPFTKIRAPQIYRDSFPTSGKVHSTGGWEPTRAMRLVSTDISKRREKFRSGDHSSCLLWLCFFSQWWDSDERKRLWKCWNGRGSFYKRMLNLGANKFRIIYYLSQVNSQWRGHYY